jgi:hypothetical protein
MTAARLLAFRDRLLELEDSVDASDLEEGDLLTSGPRARLLQVGCAVETSLRSGEG